MRQTTVAANTILQQEDDDDKQVTNNNTNVTTINNLGIIKKADASLHNINAPEHHSLWSDFKSKFEAFVKEKVFKHEGEKLLHYVSELVDNLVKEGHDHATRKDHHSIINEIFHVLAKWVTKLIDSIADHNEYFYWLAVFVEFGMVNMKGTLKSFRKRSATSIPVLSPLS